jgi:copper chaperone CopZ
MEHKTFKVPNVGCNGCVNTIKSELESLAGVQSVSGEVASKMITVDYETPATWDKIVSTLVEIDYAPEPA